MRKSMSLKEQFCMKHYLVKKKLSPITNSSQGYLWDILAHGLVERLKKIKLKGSSVALIGPSSMVIHTYLMMRYPLMKVDCFEDAWQMSDQSYDCIVINGILSWLNAPAAFIEDAFSALNTHGLFLMSALGPGTLQNVQQAAIKMNWHARADALVDMHHWGDCLLKVGFLDPVMDRQDIVIEFAKPSDWFHDWKSLGIQDLSEPACKHFITPRQWQIFLNLCHPKKEEAFKGEFECVYGHAYKPAVLKQKTTQEGVVVSLDSLKKTLRSVSKK
jgi:hypothetical protein